MISILIVSWNSGDDLAACVASLAAARPRSDPDAELIVVDNHSESPPGDEIRRAWPGARVAVLSENIGFGPAVNHAAAHARGEVLLLVNPDARALDDALGPIAAAFSEHPDWVAVAPRLVESRRHGSAPRLVDPRSHESLPRLVAARLSPSPHGPAAPKPSAKAGEGAKGVRFLDVGESQESFQLRHLPTLRQAARELLLVDRAFPGNRGRRRDRYLDRDRTLAFEVEQPAAAVLAVRASAFAAVGGFDPRFAPAWWEDVDLCARLRRIGKIMYYPAAVFAHSGGASMARLGYDRFLPLYYGNAVQWWNKHRPASAWLFRLLVAAGMLLRVAALPFRRKDPRPKRESLRAYVRAFAAAWKRTARVSAAAAVQ